MKQIINDMVEAINQKPRNEPLPLLTALNASQMVYSDAENFVQFKVKGDKGINKVKVIYDEGEDLYNVEFWSIRGLKFNMKDSIKGLFFDQLTQAIWRGVVIV